MLFCKYIPKVRDDKGNRYHQEFEQADWWDTPKQFSIDSGGTSEIYNALPSANEANNQFALFSGAIDPNAKYLIITFDQVGGMTNMNWRYDLQ